MVMNVEQPVLYQATSQPVGQYKRHLSKEEKRRLMCSHCQRTGHEASECFKLLRIPDWYKKYKDSGAKGGRVNYVDTASESGSSTGQPEFKDNSSDLSKVIQSEMAKCMGTMMQYMSGNNLVKTYANMVHESSKNKTPFEGYYAFSIVLSMENTTWIVDSGASIHICCNIELLHVTYPLQEVVMMHLPNGSSRAVRHGGKARINKDIMLVDVLYVPGFTHNLISVAHLIHDLGVKCLFYKTHCIFQKDSSDQLLGMEKMKGNLYVMETVSENYYCNFFNRRDMTVADWHVFLGHPSITTMKHMKVLNGKFHDEALKVLENCDICNRAKQTREPFPVLNRRSSSLFEIVHGDVWGPYSEPNVCESRYMLTLVEDHSRVIWTYMLHSKDQAYEVLKAYLEMVNTQFHKRVKVFRSDNRG